MPDTRYRPPTKVVRFELPYLSLVVRADPNFEVEKRREIEYEFSNGVVFRANRAKRGAYEDS